MKFALVALTIIVLANGISSFKLGPLHASCNVQWSWPNTNCDDVQTKIVNQIAAWNTDDNCANGGEKCLYSLTSQKKGIINAKHKTPVKFYVDDLTFTLTQSSGSCNVKGFSTSETWYAVLDFGTNYCNLHNLITGAGLDKIAGYTETADDSSCTQFSSADCEKY